MKDRDYLAELLFGSSSPFMFTSNSTYNPFGSDQKISSNSTQSHGIFDSEYDIELTKDGAYVSFEVPGYTKDNLEVIFENKEIKITGKRIFNKNGDTKTIKHNFRLNNYQINDANIEATVSNGILTLFLPNYVEAGKKTITIS
ncbi:MAG: Hsp20 family protein [Chitinophagaceae bacterium]|nr:Hsp20 family protein [Chitinophagaceae bacterium]